MGDQQPPSIVPLKLYKPVCLPWTARRRGTADLVWFEIVDSQGYDVFSTGSEHKRDEDSLVQDICLTLSMVNKSNICIIDGVEHRVEWI